MLPAPHRLRRPDQFRSVARRGSRAGRGTVIVHLHQSDTSSPVLFGFTVGRAVGDAVVRNQVRRRLRHAAAELLGPSRDPLLREGDQVVVRATPAAADASYAVLSEDLRGGLRRARQRADSSRASA